MCVRSNLQQSEDYASFEDKQSASRVTISNPNFELKYGDCFQNINSNQLPIINKYDNPSTFNLERYYKSKGLVWDIKLTAPKLYNVENSLFMDIKNFRQSLINRNLERYSSGSLINALALGDNQLAANTKQTLSNNGISHLFAISGAHIGIIFSIVLKMLSILRVEHTRAKRISLAIVISYGFLTAMPLSVQRALLMLSLVTVKKMQSTHALLVALALSLIFNPYVLFNRGFQLSYAITAYFIFLDKKLNKSLAYRKLFTAFFVYLLAQVILFNANYSFNLIAPLIALMITPLVIGILLPLALLLTIGYFPLLAKLFTFVTIVCERIVVFGNRFTLITGHVSIALLLIYGSLLCALFIRYMHRKKLIINMLAIGFCLLVISINYKFWPLISVIDCNQGDSIVIQFRNKVLVVDFGPQFASGESLQALKYLGVSKIDYGLISHPHLDHYGGIMQISTQIPITKVITGKNVGLKISNQILINNPLITNNVQIIGDYKWPADNINNQSLVVRIKWKTSSILLTGDIEAQQEERLVADYCQELSSTILKVAHHGLDSSTSQAFLDCVNPKVAIINSGRNNRYKHPSPSVVERLQMAQIAVYNTQQGMIQISFKKGKIRIKQ